MENNFDKVYLTYREKFLLFIMKFTHRMPIKFIGKSYDPLRQYHFILHNMKESDDKRTPKISDGTVRLSDTYLRYQIYLRQSRIHRYLTPITVSAITTVILTILQQLWLPGLLSWLQGLF